MKITAIKQQVKNPERASVFVDGKYSFSLTLDQLIDQKLKKDLVLDEGKVKKLKKLSDEGKIRNRTLEWLLNRPHSERELRDYLFKKKCEKELIDALVEEFKDRKYLDDEAFTSWFIDVRKRKNKSKRAIESELRAKGVSPVTIQSIVIETETNGGEKDSLITLVNKLSSRTRYKDETKLIAYLISKGFRYPDIKEVLNELKIND